MILMDWPPARASDGGDKRDREKADAHSETDSESHEARPSPLAKADDVSETCSPDS